VNFFAWIFIVTRRPFDVGDRVTISGLSGDVIDQRIFEFTMLEVDEASGEQSTGSLIHMPNARVIAEPLINQTRGFAYVWSEVEVLLTFESDWRLAKGRFQQLIDQQNRPISKAAENSLKKASQRYFMYYSNLTPIIYTSVEKSGVLLTIRFLVEPRRKRMEMERLWESILDEIEKESSIELAYPTSRVIRMEG
jgi:small-conductance mechanosensitive channel